MNITEKYLMPRLPYKEIVDNLKFNNNSIMIVAGSSSFKVNRYYSDIDLITSVIGLINNKKKVCDRFKEICSHFVHQRNDEFIEFKIQTKNGKKKLNDISQFTYDVFEKYNDVLFYKIDLICFVDSRYVEVSCIYSNEEPNQNKITDSLDDDIDDYIHEKKYYKALKRIYAKYSVDPETNAELLVNLQDFFNGEYGTYYNISSNLETLLKLIEYKQDHNDLNQGLLDKIETNLKYIFVDPNIDNIKKNYKKYSDLANKGARKKLLEIRRYIDI